MLIHKLNCFDKSILFEQLVEIIQNWGVMFVEQLLEFQVFVWGKHNVIQITINHFQLFEWANVSISGYLWPHNQIGDSSKFAFLHKCQLMRMILTPFNCPTLFPFKFEDRSSLSINLQNIHDTSQIHQS